MKTQSAILDTSIVLALLIAPAHASQDTIGPTRHRFDRIADVLRRTFERTRGKILEWLKLQSPGKRSPAGPDDFQDYNQTIIPEAVYLHDGDAIANQNTDNHAEYVDGVVIFDGPY